MIAARSGEHVVCMIHGGIGLKPVGDRMRSSGQIRTPVESIEKLEGIG